MGPWSGAEQPSQVLDSGGSQLQTGGSRWGPRFSGSFIGPRGLSRLAPSLGIPGYPGPFGPSLSRAAVPRRDMWRVKLQVSLLALKWGLGSRAPGRPTKEPALSGQRARPRTARRPSSPAALSPAAPLGGAETGPMIPHSPGPAEAPCSHGEPTAPSARSEGEGAKLGVPGPSP